MGSVLTPTYVGLENALELPHASTLCNQCGVACPVKIPLPDLLRKLRERQFQRRLRPWLERAGLALWAWAANRPKIYGLLTATGAKVLAWIGGRDRRIRSLPGARGWTGGRDLPAPPGKTFRQLYKRRAVLSLSKGRRKEKA
jgi:L-lactate dehydrogenase complex protein LldF